MTLIRTTTSLSAVLLQEPSVIPVINRFGIRLGVSNATVGQICDSHSLDSNFVLAILNTIVNEGYFPENLLRGCGCHEVAGYLAKADNDCRRTLVPNVLAHFGRLMSTVSGDSNMPMIHGMARRALTSLDEAIERELTEVFPLVMQTGTPGGDVYSAVATHTERMCDCWSEIADLRSMLVNLVSGDMDSNLLYAVIVAVGALENDLHKNNRLRSRILLPLLGDTTPCGAADSGL
ncbi:hypothetical protein [Muribaculum sp.]|uniref:hypothetical protein n=1 Tax=Muribaculum sp. TaxID=1918611 RepID=UPI0023CED06C|nr:hypothetical protein [Muribaculum sp.]MDE5705708.1 hypothetical protein [Muribaculum sp.]